MWRQRGVGRGKNGLKSFFLFLFFYRSLILMLILTKFRNMSRQSVLSRFLAPLSFDVLFTYFLINEHLTVS